VADIEEERENGEKKSSRQKINIAKNERKETKKYKS
jgi:hypothetical protein